MSCGSGTTPACAGRCPARSRLFRPLRCLRVWSTVLVAETVLTSRLGCYRREMAVEMLPSAKWLYCGEPDESQRAVLGNDCGAEAEFPITPPSVSGALQPSRPQPGPLPRGAETPRPPPSNLVSTTTWDSARDSSLCPYTIFLLLPPTWMRTPQSPPPQRIYPGFSHALTHQVLDLLHSLCFCRSERCLCSWSHSLSYSFLSWPLPR